jgi:hypothetical protein
MDDIKIMFKELGYKRCRDYRKYGFISYYKNLKNKKLCINFNTNKKTFSKFKCGLAIYLQDEEDLDISMEEFEAIKKQIEELGW